MAHRHQAHTHQAPLCMQVGLRGRTHVGAAPGHLVHVLPCRSQCQPRSSLLLLAAPLKGTTSIFVAHHHPCPAPVTRQKTRRQRHIPRALAPRAQAITQHGGSCAHRRSALNGPSPDRPARHRTPSSNASRDRPRFDKPRGGTRSDERSAPRRFERKDGNKEERPADASGPSKLQRDEQGGERSAPRRFARSGEGRPREAAGGEEAGRPPFKPGRCRRAEIWCCRGERPVPKRGPA